MNSRYFVSAYVLFFLGAAFVSCSSDDAIQSGLISSNVSSCKSFAETRAEGEDVDTDRSHHLEYEITSDSRLHLTDVNHYVPCNMTAFDVDAAVKGDTITVKERRVLGDGDAVTTCYCPIDVDLVIGLPEKRTYTLVIAVEGLIPEVFTISNTPGSKGRFDLKGIAQPKFDMEVDGIYYNIISEVDKTVEVTSYPYYGGFITGYTGDVVIPEQVNYRGVTYTVTSVGDYVFVLNSLTSIYLPNTIREIKNSFLLSCENLVSVHLPENITVIPEMAFFGCVSLTEITIPESVTGIGNAAFAECNQLRRIYVKSKEAPKMIPDYYNPNPYLCYDEVKQEATLYVPQGCIDAYRSAEEWKDFVHIDEWNTEEECPGKH